MRIILTGGHLTPALALLPKLSDEYEILFIGRKHAFEGDEALSMEYKTLKDLGVPFKTITTGRLERRFTFYTIPSLLKVPIGFIQSLMILFQYKPRLVFSFGGYVALPVSLAAFLLGIPIVTHEQTVLGGLSNRIIAPIAKKICISFRESGKYFPAQKTILTGNPLRKELFETPKDEPTISVSTKTLPLLYVTGGSSGSHSINILIEQVLETLVRKYVVIHQIGDTIAYKDFDRLCARKEKLSKKMQENYIPLRSVSASELSWIYKQAALLIGRSGANTVYEILSFGVPSLLIPLPWAGKGEQEANARLVENVGLGKMVRQEKLTPNLFLSTLDEMLSKREKFRENASKASQFVIPNADKNILEVLRDVARS